MEVFQTPETCLRSVNHNIILIHVLASYLGDLCQCRKEVSFMKQADGWVIEGILTGFSAPNSLNMD